MQAWSFTLELANRTIKTYVYSDTGKDIEQRFPNCTVSNIVKLKTDPTLNYKEEQNDSIQ